MGTANEEKELMKFISNPSYREKIISKIHKEKDVQYKQHIKSVEKVINNLNRERINEINRISNARWENVLKGRFLINRTEGIVRINQKYVPFSSIKSAEINVQQSFQTITTDNTKSKKHMSIGGALIGAALVGGVGAIAGGIGLGKTTTKGKSVSNQIPICTHLGVLVNIDGFVSEISLLTTQVEQSSTTFTAAYNLAQNIVAQLVVLSKTPVPNNYVKPEEEITVKNIENEISDKKVELQKIIANKPVYELPNIYRSEEQKEMSDDEYIEYLKKNDLLRNEKIPCDKKFAKQEKEILKEIKRKECSKKCGNNPVKRILFYIKSALIRK